MNSPVCDQCAGSGVLCGECEKRLERGEISELDVEVARLFHGLGLKGVGFEKAVDTRDQIIILTKKENIGRIIGKGGETLRTLSQKLGRKVRVIGAENLQSAIHDFVAPARVISVNTVYLPGGGLLRRIRISRADKKKLRMEPVEIEAMISSLTKDKVEIAFE